MITCCVDAEVLRQFHFVEDNASVASIGAHRLGLYCEGLEQVFIEAKAAFKVLDVMLEAGPAGQNQNFLFSQVFVQLRASQ